MEQIDGRMSLTYGHAGPVFDYDLENHGCKNEETSPSTFGYGMRTQLIFAEETGDTRNQLDPRTPGGRGCESRGTIIA